MSSKFDNFMNDDPFDDDVNISFTTIARVEIYTGYQGWNNNKPEIFSGDKTEARKKCQSYCGAKQYPNFGIITKIYGDDVPTHPDGMFDDDRIYFVPAGHSRKKFQYAAGIKGDLPYDLVLEGIKNNQQIFEGPGWCLLEEVVDTVKQYFDNKKPEDQRRNKLIKTMVVKKFFNSRDEATAGIVEENEEDKIDLNDWGEELNPFSKTAQDHGWKGNEGIETLKAMKKSIYDRIAEIWKGDNPEGEKIEYVAAVKLAVTEYGIDPEDLNLVQDTSVSEEEIPF